MARSSAFERDLRVATKGLEPAAIKPLLVRVAKQALADAQASGEAPRAYVRIVNGRIGATEESVELPGPIIYQFSWFEEIATYGLAFAKARSPARSGRYRNAWFVLVNGRATANFADIPPDAELIITNDVPYARKIEVGKTESGRPFVIEVPPGIVEDTRLAIMRRFGNIVRVERRFISLAGGYTSRRGRMTYPAVVINSVI